MSRAPVAIAASAGALADADVGAVAVVVSVWWSVVVRVFGCRNSDSSVGGRDANMVEDKRGLVTWRR